MYHLTQEQIEAYCNYIKSLRYEVRGSYVVFDDFPTPVHVAQAVFSINRHSSITIGRYFGSCTILESKEMLFYVWLN